ncbi:DUF4350 domain-containing protein [Thiorhodococcus mannitoliphagus]|uniref:DUF4350 domain-containing protein n=1 Tax=Thiorhodococcus mannitoliphagus TaxID=329406 RepID=A0A6P1DT42_9GAMM|nr:DUF4350 domain-containing protein [Thiorhodococcus mannitoliphagus]NEX19192.1 DUF4350 domain-containing protein [Thiorhodococcus mannitoliphagus]
MGERRTLSLVVGGLVLIAIAAMPSWFFTSFERRTERIPVGYSAEARRNALLAAERFLIELELPVESVTGRDRLWSLPAATDTLVVLGLGPMSAERQARLIAWLEQGGHLIVEAMDTWEEDAPSEDFLSALGFRLLFDAGEGSDDDRRVIATLDLGPVGRPVQVAFHADYALEGQDGDDILAAVADRPRILQRPIGQGRLTVLSDTAFLTNTAIGEHDHAYFALHLLAPGEGGKVWLLYDSDMPWLGGLLWGIAPYALTSLGVLLLIWLWSLGARLGPLVQAPDRRRRDLIEHLDASGDFLWRHNQTSALVESSRKRILGDWLSRHPDIAHQGPHAQAEAVAAFTGESVERIYRSLFAQPDDARAFTEQAMLLQQLRQSARGGKFGT